MSVGFLNTEERKEVLKQLLEEVDFIRKQRTIPEGYMFILKGDGSCTRRI